MESQPAILIVKSLAGSTEGAARWSVPAGQTVAAALAALPDLERRPFIPVVNGVTEAVTYVLRPGDVVQLLPQIMGG
jgi:molybdopterin converting factor small subunit